MKNRNYLILLTALAVVACDDDAKMSKPTPGGELPEEDASGPDIVEPEDGEDADIVEPEPDAEIEPGTMGGMMGGMMGGGDPDAGGEAEPDAGEDAGPPKAAWYTCQSTDQQ